MKKTLKQTRRTAPRRASATLPQGESAQLTFVGKGTPTDLASSMFDQLTVHGRQDVVDLVHNAIEALAGQVQTSIQVIPDGKPRFQEKIRTAALPGISEAFLPLVHEWFIANRGKWGSVVVPSKTEPGMCFLFAGEAILFLPKDLAPTNRDQCWIFERVSPE